MQFKCNRIWKFVSSDLYYVIFLMFRLWHIFGTMF
jgi:hypothetical protein